MRFQRKKQTDAGTIVLHWWLAVSLLLSTLTGLRFAIDMPDTAYLKAVEPLLPVANIWIIHILAGVSVMGLAVAYPIYLLRTGLFRRIWLDRARLASLALPGKARWGAVNVLLYWALFAGLLVQVVTGLLMHRGYGGVLVDIHLFVTWLIIGYVVAHVSAHLVLGGMPQLLRVLRPSRIPAPDTGSNSADVGATPFHRPSKLAGIRIFGISAIAGVSIGVSFLYVDRMSRDVLRVERIDKAAAASLRPDLSDPAWRNARALHVHTNQGTNFDGTGASTVDVRALHDGESIYLAVTWDDPTRSLKHTPLIKAEDGWHALFTPTNATPHASVSTVSAVKEPANFEATLAEDKFAIMLANVEKPFGPGAFHPGGKPLGDKPPSSSGRGLHYTEDGSSVNLWLWHADGEDARRCESNLVGPAARPTADEARGLAPYKGGYLTDAAESAVIENFTPSLPRDWQISVHPLRLPKDLGATHTAMRTIDLDPDHGEPDDARWWLSESESQPYSADLDAAVPVGTIIPGLLAPSHREPRASDVSCAARWTAGRWTLLAQRRLEANRATDVPINRHTHMWVAAFDHTPANHTRHIRPIRLEIAP
jgi:cytochrome b subunit of formate dehydrogenase